MAGAPPIPISNPWGNATTPYVELGGDAAVRGLAATFYATIDEQSPPLRAMLPKRLEGSIEKFYEYLSGWLGGPQLYVAKRGHPRLRMRHLPFPIGSFEVDEWLRCMGITLDACGVDGPLRAVLDERFATVAHHLRNQ
jgi:hemoglobin